jgi:hypothetical protein
MNTADALWLEHFEPLDEQEMLTTGSGPWIKIGITVGTYLLKTVAENWGDFKEGLVEGYNAAGGTRRRAA